MPHAQPTTPAAATPVFADALVQDPDFALGCECADPRLTIEMWGGEEAQAAPQPEQHH